MNGVKVTVGTFKSVDCVNCRPQNSKELYNLRHASLRNAIERIFGVLKRRFKILTQQIEYPFEVQVRLVKALCCLHNIIRVKGGDDWFDEEWERNAQNERSVSDNFSCNEREASNGSIAAQVKLAKKMRDDIAAKMWAQYSST